MPNMKRISVTLGARDTIRSFSRRVLSGGTYRPPLNTSVPAATKQIAATSIVSLFDVLLMELSHTRCVAFRSRSEPLLPDGSSV